MLPHVKDSCLCQRDAVPDQNSNDLYRRSHGIGHGPLPLGRFKRRGSEAARFSGFYRLSWLPRCGGWADENPFREGSLAFVSRGRRVQDTEPSPLGRSALKFRGFNLSRTSLEATVNSIKQVWDTNEVHEIIVRPYKHSRSLEQNNMFHGLCRAIAKETGNSVAEIKDYCKENFLGVSSYEFNGEVKQRLRSTNELTTDEMSELIARTEALASELGVQHATT